eukprot:TRINITY_DN14850_c0_g1_i1.p2 TRINITY_DN14850_c0_g1~~TRINITY_DN14850_c0_g1_i1.p2  ORF type:complete len:110 (-),score=3.44 TRINITY_DN14850_c0_g1_i1:456-755(-)
MCIRDSNCETQPKMSFNLTHFLVKNRELIYSPHQSRKSKLNEMSFLLKCITKLRNLQRLCLDYSGFSQMVSFSLFSACRFIQLTVLSLNFTGFPLKLSC